MYESELKNPNLVQSDIKHMANKTLYYTHIAKERIHNFIYNIVLIVGLTVVMSIFFYINIKNRKSDKEIKEYEEKKRNLILSKIQNYQNERAIKQIDSLTGLPAWNSNVL
tara:strand:- start:1636 stop:1965 length:330 start_codon:yes stop_codon:yes gene_type:complete